MKKSTKILGVILAFVILLTSVLPMFAFAEEAEEKAYTCPHVYVPGFMSSDIVTDKTDPDSKLIYPWSTEDILKMVKGLIPALGRLSLTRDWDRFAEDVNTETGKFFGPSMVDGNGMPADGSGVYFEYPEPESIAMNSELTFRYDWRVDPLEIADELNDFIEYVCDCTGSDKVTVECHSLGGVILISYIAKYGDARIKTAVLNTTAIYGETYTGELLTGQITFDADALLDFLEYTFDYNDYENILNGCMRLLKNAGLFDFACKFADLIVEKIAEQVMPATVAPLFAGWLSIWAMVPDKDIDAATDYVFNNIYKNDENDRTEIQMRIKNFNTTVRANREDILTHLDENANVYVISRYGYCSIPITPSSAVMTDGVIDTKLSSFGATCSQYGETLSDEYTASKDAKYISPDKTVDASTCRFPEQTWFVKNLKHSDSPRDLDAMIYAMSISETQLTCDTLEGYSRFMKYTGDEIIKYEGGDLDPAGFFARVKNIFSEIFKMFKNLFLSIFKIKK